MNNKKLCISISDKSIEVAKQKFWHKDFLLELRLDLISRQNIKMFYDCPAQIIITCKNDIKKPCLSIYKEFITNHIPFGVDIEYHYLKDKNWFDFFQSAKNQKIKTILSYHDYANTPNYDELRSIYTQMLVYVPDFIKIVTTGQVAKDLQTIDLLYKKEKPVNLIAFLMGEYALESRIKALKNDAPWIYVSPTQETKTANNQPDYYTIKESLRL